MSEPITITVTAEDIRDGIKQSCYDCPIALAVSRMFPNSVVTAGLWVRVTNLVSNKRFSANLPIEAFQFMTRFDCDFSVEPFSFTLTLN